MNERFNEMFDTSYLESLIGPKGLDVMLMVMFVSLALSVFMATLRLLLEYGIVGCIKKKWRLKK